MRSGWLRSAPGDDVACTPMSNGSSGLLRAVAAARGGQTIVTQVDDPWGRAVPAAILLVEEPTGRTAYLESAPSVGDADADDSAESAGLAGTSAGVGAAVSVAIDEGARRIVLGAGASACHDGGLGMLWRLGRPGPWPETGSRQRPEGHDPARAAGLLARARDRIGSVEIVLAASSLAPLVGLHGAGAALAGRPGIGPERAQVREREIAAWAAAVERAAPARRDLLAGAAPRTATRPGSGAGGGLGFAVLVLGGRVLPGPAAVATEIGLAAQLSPVDVVVTGAVVIDSAQAHDGVIAAVGRAASEMGLPVVAVGARVQATRRELAPIGVSGLYELPEPVSEAVVIERMARVARTWSW